MKKKALPAALLLAAACHTANAEEWICGLWEEEPTKSSKSSFDYDIKLDGPTTARVEVTPTTPGGKDDAEAGTSYLLVLQNSPDGVVMAGSGSGPTQYGRGAYGSLLILNRETKSAVQSFALSAEKIGYVNPPRMGTCTRAK
ncbi:hypothetical protein [Burkholderia pyrrocinia]|uniref:hypothetical protein n=1 Tax=Burkholderia pyrrocinia TaxID=60550 RepID=UPI0030CF602A